MLNPGKRPHENLQFLLVLAAVIRAVDENAVLLRMSASVPGNDHRLGAHEAPPAIVSIFLGEQLEDVVNQMVETGEALSSKKGGKLSIGVHSLPMLSKDATDRNRTSPFAFTGNKFEFRMVASSMSIAEANTVLNTIVADVFEQMADELEPAKQAGQETFDQAVHELIKRTLAEHQRIIFNGNGYSEEWVEEAARRGLPNKKTMVDAIPSLVDPKTIELFERQHVYSRTELESRAEIHYEAYAKAVNIEAKTMVTMASDKYIPAVIRFATELAQSINAIRTAVPEADVSVQTELLTRISELLTIARKATVALQAADTEANARPEGVERATAFKEQVIPVMNELRDAVDELETMVAKDSWPVPTYGDLLFEV